MAQPIKVSVSTQIRNFYSEGNSCLNLRFYNSTLSISLYPFTGKDNNNRSQYDSRHGQQSTINYESAYGLYKLAREILDGKITECNYPIQCLGAMIIFERKLGQNGVPETSLSITKNNVTIVFKFPTTEYSVKENGQMVNKTMESCLGAFAMTLEGFLTGINSDRHLNKLTDEFAQAQEERNGKKNQPQPMPDMQQQQYGQQQYRPSPQYNQRRGYNNYQRNNQWGGPAQNMSNYSLPPG